MAWNGTCQVGCAIAACHYLSLDDFSSYLNYIGVNSDEVSGTRYLVVCNYGPGNPDNTLPPYTDGSSCSACPAEYPLCYEVKEPDDVGGDEYDDEMRGLCR